MIALVVELLAATVVVERFPAVLEMDVALVVARLETGVEEERVSDGVSFGVV